ncbi:GNAT family N-acetyltransferase [Nocardioides sp. Soil805]|uniref:GNAT family N-acetyltransferase n=1 Tax=Nocardioides sp. Soil805 TaxID=1736416 RepID=UPI0009EA6E57|nr:GNAT family N-acetyltransferase [Nocardioides sp. Soil805]
MSAEPDLDDVRRRYREVNGDHPMSEVDDAYVRTRFAPATAEQLDLMAAGLVPLPSYLLSDGTPMVPRDHLDPVDWAGGTDRLHDWFVGYWPADRQAEAEDEWAAYLSGRYVCLQHVSPLTIRDKTRWTAQLDAALERLAADPRDHVGRGMVGEAVSRLEDLLLPQTSYDALRFGGPSSWQRLQQVREDHLTPPLPELPIRTERLVLRRATPADADDMHAYYGREDVTEHLLHDAFSRPEIDDMLRRRLAGPRSHTACNLVVELEGRVVGDLVVFLKGEGHDMAEIGWVIHPDVGGRGIATEAATAMLDLAFGHYGVHRVFADLDTRNPRSAALARRLGMRLELDSRADFWSKGEWTDSQRWAILAEEWAARNTR